MEIVIEFIAGNGLKLQWADLNERTLYDAITTIINQPRLIYDCYYQSVK